MIKKRILPPIDEVRRLLDYDTNLGRLVWRMRSGADRSTKIWNIKHAGKIAGAANGPYRYGPYRYVKVLGKLYSEHRLIWYHVHGDVPDCDLDHINGLPTDNRVENLRPAVRRQNIQNQKLRFDNKTGLKGVITRKDSRTFGARITVNGNRYIIGWFDTAQLAHEAYCAEAVKHFGEFARAA